MSDAREDVFQLGLTNGWKYKIESPYSFWSETFTGPSKQIVTRWVNGKLTQLRIWETTELDGAVCRDVRKNKLLALKAALSV